MLSKSDHQASMIDLGGDAFIGDLQSSKSLGYREGSERYERGGPVRASFVHFINSCVAFYYIFRFRASITNCVFRFLINPHANIRYLDRRLLQYNSTFSKSQPILYLTTHLPAFKKGYLNAYYFRS